jgi:hypothetical protein
MQTRQAPPGWAARRAAPAVKAEALRRARESNSPQLLRESLLQVLGLLARRETTAIRRRSAEARPAVRACACGCGEPVSRDLPNGQPRRYVDDRHRKRAWWRERRGRGAAAYQRVAQMALQAPAAAPGAPARARAGSSRVPPAAESLSGQRASAPGADPRPLWLRVRQDGHL